MSVTTTRSTGARFPLLCAATLFEFTALGIYLAALPLFVTRELGGSRSAVGIAIGAFSLTAVLLRPSTGRGIDRRGRRPFLAAAPAILVVTSLGFVFVDAVPGAVALRLLQGVAGACFYTAAATVATDLAPEGRRAEYLARFSLFLYGGLAIGPALGEAVVGGVGYGWTWVVAAGAALVSLGFALALPETRPVLPSATGLPGGEGAPADAPAVAGATLSAAAPRRSPASRFLHPAAVAPGVVIMTAATGYAGITGFMALYARQIGMGSSGPLYATFAVTVLVVRLFAGRLADRHGRVVVALPGMATAAAAMTLLALEPSPALAFVGVAGFGAGFSLVFPALIALTVDRAPERERGAAVGSFTAFFDIGTTVGSYTIGAVADRFGFGGGYGVPAALCVAGMAILTRLGRRVRDEAAAIADEAPLPEPSGA